MGDDVAKHHPGQNDISNQFSPANIGQTLSDFKALFSNGDYAFGELTAKFYNLSDSEHHHWHDSVGLYPVDVQNEIKRHVIYALTRVDANGADNPTPISFKWQNPTGPQSITCIYQPGAQPSYAIVIAGFPAPLASPFADRRGKY